MKKIIASFLLALIIVLGLVQPSPAHAMIPVFDSIAAAATNVWNAKGEIAENLLVALNKAANRTFSTLLSQWINKVAQESAIYLVSGSKGEKPAFMTMKKGEFWKQLGDEALGTFTENFFSALQENHEEVYTDIDSFSCVTTNDIKFENVKVNVFGDFHMTTDPVTLVETRELENLHLKYTVYDKNTILNDKQEEVVVTVVKSGYPKSIHATKSNCPNGVSYYTLPNDNVNKVCLTEMQNDGDINSDCLQKALSSLAKVATGQGSRGTVTSGSADYLNTYLSGEKKLLGMDIGSGKLNICQPSSLAVSLKVGLGLPQPGKSGGGVGALPCSWQEMKKNWTQFRKETIGDPTKLIELVQDMFEPGSNDLSIAFDIHSSQGSFVEYQKTSKSEDLDQSFGLNVKSDPGDRMLELPFAVKWNLEKSMDNIKSPWLSNTADAFLNAVNLFISTASNAAYEKYMAKLMSYMNKQFGDDPTGSTGSTDNSLYSYYSSSPPGLSRAQSEEIMAPLTEMNFGEGKDVNLLSHLAACPDISNPGPMNCVVNDSFMQAIIQGMTVGEAISKKLINENATFGMATSDPSFNLGSGDISWRAMKIMRKYRILPAGWELAAEQLNHRKEKAKIKDMIDCFYHEGEWCQGLVDPNWLLKAPLTYCAKSGFGGQLEDIRIVGEDTIGNDAIGSEQGLGQISVLRAGDYCADEQTCIKEGSNSSCELYGYCIEDQRTWQFPGKTCQPQFNTCQTYTNQQGQSVAYLSNTLDYGNLCDADNAGCLAYCSNYDWLTNSYSCQLESSDNKYYLSGKAEACSENNDGCTQLIRINTSSGSNLLFNGDFESSLPGTTLRGSSGSGVLPGGGSTGGIKSSNNQLDNWYFNTSDIEAEIIDNSSGFAFSGKSLKVITSGNNNGLISTDWSVGQQSSLPKNFLMRPGVSYTLSAYIYTTDVPVTIAIGNNSSGLWVRKTAQPDSSWQKLSVTINNDNYYRANAFTIYATQPGTFYLDNIMFEVTSHGNQGFLAYRQSGYFYKKIVPEYLSPYCYEVTPSGLVKREDAPLECNNYARPCTAQEVDCQMFTGANTQVPAKTSLQNYCPSSCVGFDNFWQEPTIFAGGQYQNLIPDLATSCSAQNVGCSEFTSLDGLESGGESKEYYSYLRQCVKPSEANANCQVFYIWHNTESEGLQLRSYTWQAENNQPKLVNGDQNTCTAASLWPNNIDYDPDCREIRDQSGNVFYIPYSQTISCSEDCRTYRISEQNIVDNIFSSTDCSAASGNWLANRGVCVVCQGNGQWDNQSSSCLYRGLPEESQPCSESQNGCRRYSGSGSANWWSIFTDDFDHGQEEWSGGVTSTETFRSEGYSLLAQSNSLARSLQASDLVDGLKYRLQFFAKSNTVNQFTKIAIQQDGQDLVIFDLANNSALSKDWQMYTFTTDNSGQFLSSLTDSDSSHFLNTALKIMANGSFFVDEVRLIEPNDEYYLINSSITVPQVCNSDYNGQPSAGFMLGCQVYQDQSANTHYLHSFSDLCQESSVGCEMMINTHNITDYQPLKTLDPSEIDEVVYVVYDQGHLCSVNDKGCQRLGRESSYGSQSAYETTFLKLDLDRYDSASLNSIRCSTDNVGCQAWSSSNGPSYFKDPGNQLCEWREGSDGFNWYQRPISICSNNGSNKKFCLTDQDCISVSEDSQCLESKEDQLCPVTSENDYNLKTIGPGGYLVKQPISSGGYNWTGLCPVTRSGCTEYIDPLFKVGVNLEPCSPETPDTFNIDKLTAYSIQVQSSAETEVGWNVVDDNYNNLGFWLFNQDNRFISTSSPQTLVSTGQGGSNYYASFVSKDSGRLKIISSDPLVKIVVKKLSVNYNLNQDVNSDGCVDGLVDYDRGCILFNARGYSQNNYSTLYYDASLTTNDAKGASPRSSVNNNANQLIKVDLDRACSKWLECTSQGRIVLEDGSIQMVCYSFGVCDQLNENNQCVSFVNIDTNKDKNQFISTSTPSSGYSVSDIANLTGYSKVGWDNTGYYNDMYILSSMSERGGTVSDVSINGSFELTSGGLSAENLGYLIYDYKPIGWSSSNNVSVVVSPSQAGLLNSAFKDINKAMAPDGRNFLRIGVASTGNGDSITNNFIPVAPSTTYILSGDYRTDNHALAGFVVEIYTSDTAGPSPVTSTLDWVDQWQTKTFEFKTYSTSNYIKIKLYVKNDDGYSGGAAYFDNIKLSPALNYRSDIDESNSYIAPSCRLYPKGDSLSCDYRLPDNPGIREKGLLGYCLEYDPANTNNCLLWFPVDRVGADLVEEGVGYSGKLPLYYCIDWEPVQRLEYRHAFWINSDDGNKCPPHYYRENLQKGCNTGSNSKDSACVPYGSGLIKREYSTRTEFDDLCDGSFVSSTNNHLCLECGGDSAASDIKNSNVLSWSDGWYLYDENVPSTSTNDQVATAHRLEVFNDADGSIKKVGRGPTLRLNSFSASSLEFLCQASGNNYNESIFKCLDVQGKEALLTSEIYRDEFNINVTNKEKQVPFQIYYCSKFIKVVDDIGNNMFYSDRVNIDSSYEAGCWIIKDGGPTSTRCIFTESSMPYGSIAYPANQGTQPDKWDSLPDVSGNQPLFFGYNSAGSVHAGYKYSLDQLKQLFAKSYGTYQWVASTSTFVSQGSYNIMDSPSSDKISPPDNNCLSSFGYCYIEPTISNIKVNDRLMPDNNFIDVVGKNVSLSFSVKIADNQRPLRKISINWGDGTITSVSGNLLDRQNENQPHIFDHIYTSTKMYIITITVSDNWEKSKTHILYINVAGQ